MEHGATRSLFSLPTNDENGKLDKSWSCTYRANVNEEIDERTTNSLCELKIIEKLEKLKDLKDRNLFMDHDAIMLNHFLIHVNSRSKIEEEERLIREIFNQQKCKEIDSEKSLEKCENNWIKFCRGEVKNPPKNHQKFSFLKIQKHLNKKDDANNLVAEYSSSGSEN
ncbi:hypothetical protein RF11_05711 [Thelohanellus kitauei]|uniref:Uncharacterized protein n=1 Tax=Thelohanellus kitauei TaxID=669202 RepID=A0A0C2MNA4_THEKT|nr:hypothetical protein RF11_05711 [Thelohanellus kitauei]